MTTNHLLLHGHFFFWILVNTFLLSKEETKKKNIWLGLIFPSPLSLLLFLSCSLYLFFSSPQQLVTGNHNHIHISLSKTVTLSQFFRTTSDLVRANVSLLLANCYQIFTTLTVGPKPNQAIYLSIFTIKSVIQRFTYSFTSDFCYHLSSPINSYPSSLKFTKN